MRRTGFDERRDHEIANDYHAGHMACSFCRSMSPKVDLAAYGARCAECCRDYCDGGRTYPALTKADKVAMAQRLRQVLAGGLRPDARRYMAEFARRVDAGELTSPGQRGFLASARRIAGDVDPAPMTSAPAAPAAPPPIVRRAEPELATHDDPPPWATEGAGE